MSVGIANGPDPYQTACFSLICIKNVFAQG